MKCHYCVNEDLKKAAYIEEKVYLWYCEPCDRTTTEPHMETCLVCKKEYEFWYDPGWNEDIICLSCRQKATKEYFDDPAIKKELKKLIENQEPNSWTKYINKGDVFSGYAPVPVLYKTFEEK